METESKKPAKMDVANESNPDPDSEATSLSEPSADPQEKVSLAEALAKIDTSHLSDFLAHPPESYPGIEVFELVKYFGSALSEVSSMEYQYPWPNMNKLRELIDLPFRHIPQDVYKTAADWIQQVNKTTLGTFIMWSFCWTRDCLAGHPAGTRSQLGVLIALSIILRSKPNVFIFLLPLLRRPKYQLEHSPEMVQFTVWMMAQVAQVDLYAGFHSWAHILLPFARDRFKCTPQSMDLILQLLENVFLHPTDQATILNHSPRCENVRLFPISSFEILLPLTFRASFDRGNDTKRFEALYPKLKEVALADAPGKTEMVPVTRRIFALSLKFAREGNAVLAKEATEIAIWCLTRIIQDTERFEAVYPLLKEVALADAPGRTAMNQVTQRIFAFSLKLAAEANPAFPVLAKEATAIAAWCVSNNVDCCNHWEAVYMDNLEASVALLKKLVDEWEHHSLKLLSSPRDTRILNLTMKSFLLKNKKRITERGGVSGCLYEEADKYNKEISRRLSSRGFSFHRRFLDCLFCVKIIEFFLFFFSFFFHKMD